MNRYAKLAAATMRTIHRRKRVAELMLTGQYKQEEIAAMLGVVLRTVCRDVSEIKKEWRAATAETMEVLKAKELARLDAVEREAWVQWERSRVRIVDGREEGGIDRVQVTEKSAVPPAADGTAPAAMPVIERTRTTERLLPDPRYLERVTKCIELRAKILGIRPSEMEEFGESVTSAIERIYRRVTGKEGCGDDTGKGQA